MHVAAYIRVGTDDPPRTAAAFQAQQSAIAEYCDRHGLHLVLALRELAAGSHHSRAGIVQLEALARAGAIQAVVCVSRGRLSHCHETRRAIEAELERHGCSVFYTDPADALLSELVHEILYPLETQR